MNDKYFIDTNILVYANDPSEIIKQPIARNLILDGIKMDSIAISAQVLSEFYVTVTKKISKPLDPEIAFHEIQLLRYVDIAEIDTDLVLQAIKISRKYKLSYWDALIIAAAIFMKTNILYSEDLNHGQIIENIQIINPFII